jgi:hypothetical protein
MISFKRPIFLFLLFSFFICSAAKAQIEVIDLISKNYSAIGFGAYLNISVPVSDADAVSAELNLAFFRIMIPMLALYPYNWDISIHSMVPEPDFLLNRGRVQLCRHGYSENRFGGIACL